ncbi:unnamed protein product [Ambrosiozyma monospora]|uniref:Unnamed protein product n=1 Tax=Ambrosiozyma monospora TaxID=43982 RepID=A0ACB5TSG2_AMBMO|nr:unnamed protein product [Ambrosiozyma monospora]
MARSKSPTKRTRSKSPTKQQRLPVMLSSSVELPPLVSPVLNYFNNLSLKDRSNIMSREKQIEKLRNQTGVQIIVESNIRRKIRGPETDMDNAQKRAKVIAMHCSGEYTKYSLQELANEVQSENSTVQNWLNEFKNAKTVALPTGRHMLPPLPEKELSLVCKIYHVELERKGKYPTTNFLLNTFKELVDDESPNMKIGSDRFEGNVKYLSLKTLKDQKSEEIKARGREREYILQFLVLVSILVISYTVFHGLQLYIYVSSPILDVNMSNSNFYMSSCTQKLKFVFRVNA